jgi:hypothetical protein
LFKIGHHKDLKNAQKTKIGPKCRLPNMRIDDNNRNKHTDTVSKNVIRMQISKSEIRILRDAAADIANNRIRMYTPN